MISVNEKSQILVKDLIDNHNYYRVNIEKGHNGCTIIDAGINSLGNMEAGRVISEICLGGLGRVHILNTMQNAEWPLTVHVNTNDPVIACLGSQYAGWSLSSKEDGSKFNAEILITPNFANGKDQEQTGYCGITKEINEDVNIPINFSTKIFKGIAITRGGFTLASILPMVIVAILLNQLNSLSNP